MGFDNSIHLHMCNAVSTIVINDISRRKLKTEKKFLILENLYK